MIVKVRLTTQMVDRLVDMAAQERRPLTWQLEAIIEQALGISQAEATATHAPTPPAHATPEQKNDCGGLR